MKRIRVLHLEDEPSHATLVAKKVSQAGINAEMIPVTSIEEFQAQLSRGDLSAIVLDNGLPGMSGLDAVKLSRERAKGAPIIVLSGSASEQQVLASLAAGAQEYVVKGQWWQLIAALHRVEERIGTRAEQEDLVRHDHGVSRLLTLLQELTHLRDLSELISRARSGARELTGADGAAFVLRDGDVCTYVDGEGTAALLRGRKIAVDRCLSGWVMKRGCSVAIENAEADSRAGAELPLVTGARSILATPIRHTDPLGAIEVYWASAHCPTRAEIEILEALANTIAVVMENIELYRGLERSVHDRTLQLEDTIVELEAFSYSVCHDLRSPLQTIGGFAEILEVAADAQLDSDTRSYLGYIQDGVRRMTQLVDDLLRLAQIGKADLGIRWVNLTEMAGEIAAELRLAAPGRVVDFTVHPNIRGCADPGLIRVALQNLLSNAWKYTGKCERPQIEFGTLPDERHGTVFFVKDNGAGFDPSSADRLFTPFQRLHAHDEFSGTGVGLATVQRVIHRHTGQIWAEAAPGRGATFYFTLPEHH